MDNYKYLVRVSCMTYNHAPYIVDAMNGFCMQETTFPFVCIIVDDASTDSEQEVIRGYLKEHFDLDDKSVVRKEETDDYYLTFAQHKTNRNCFFAVLFLKYNHYSIKKPKKPYFEEWCDTKYIAICEGDDYWTSPKKLQQQAQFMENHPDYSLCFHGAKLVLEDVSYAQSVQDMGKLEEREYSVEEIYKQWLIPTASVVYRSDIMIEKDKRFIFGDLVLFLSCATRGKLYCFSTPMSVYRRHFGGVSTKKMSHSKRLNYQLAIREHFPQYKKMVDSSISKIFVGNFYSGGLNKDSWEVCKTIIMYPRYIIPAIIYTPCYLSDLIKRKLHKA